MQALAIRILGSLVVLVVVFGLGGWLGRSWTVDHYEAQIASDNEARMEQERATERAWQDVFNYNARRLTDESNALDVRLNAALVELRKRPMRPDSAPNTRAGCEGANGAELGGEYAELLARWASRAALQDEALAICYSNADALTGVK